MVSTPFDMFINQIVENHRANQKHGSCGFGIWETKKRYENEKYSLKYKQIIRLNDKELEDYLYSIANEYFFDRLSYYGIHNISKEYQYLINSDGLIKHYISDLREMQSVIRISTFKNIRNFYNGIVFEGAQGLELDENNKKALPHVTASDTTSHVPLERVKDFDCDIEICYITRTYFTRHGAGMFPTECNKSDINKDITDLTNCHNDYQGTIRYGLFDYNEFIERVKSDIKKAKNICNVKTSVMITHLNYTNNEITGNCVIKNLLENFDAAYLSNSKFSEDMVSLYLKK